jgi:hypothetical protein
VTTEGDAVLFLPSADESGRDRLRQRLRVRSVLVLEQSNRTSGAFGAEPHGDPRMRIACSLPNVSWLSGTPTVTSSGE